MAQPYKYIAFRGANVAVRRVADQVDIPINAPGNADYQRWQSDGGNAVTDPADAQPTQKSAILMVSVEDVRTTTATQATLASWPLALQTLYTARFTILALDTGNGDTRAWHATATAKRIGAGALLVGTPAVVSSHADAGAAGWALAADVSGNDFRVRVTGASGRTISWSLVGEVFRARPDGLVD